VKRTLAALTLALALPASAGEGDLRFRLVLHGRFTDRENRPQPAILYDRAARAFALGGYLRPQGSDRYPSVFASAGVEGRHGWFRWALTADTGELRSQSFPAIADVCIAPFSPTTLDVCGSRRIESQQVFAVEETRLEPARLVSNGRPIGEEVRNTLLLREAWAGAALGRNDFALVKAGRKRFTVADGFVYDDYATGVEATFDLGAIGPSWDLGAALFYPTRDFPGRSGVTSVMLALRADYLPSLFEHAGLFVALFRDRSDTLADLFRGSISEASVVKLRGPTAVTPEYNSEQRTLAAAQGSLLESDGWLGWTGTSGSLAVLGAKLDWTGALGFGRFAIRLPLLPSLEASSTSVLGQLAHVRLRARAGREMELGGFFLYLSGDLPPTEKRRLGLPERYGGFLGISPFITATNIFFNGGVGESFASRQATAPGVNGRGVIAPGLTASWDPLRTLAVDARAAYLLAPEEGPFGGRVYGPELDLEVTWSPLHWLTFAAEGDVLFPGDFFAGRAPVTKVVLGVDLVAM
jgi:hypothetical protein